MQNQLQYPHKAIPHRKRNWILAGVLFLGAAIVAYTKAMAAQIFILAGPVDTAGAASSSYINTRTGSPGTEAAGYHMTASSAGTSSWYSPGFSLEDGERPFVQF